MIGLALSELLCYFDIFIIFIILRFSVSMISNRNERVSQRLSWLVVWCILRVGRLKL